jgi:small subunit ribosomal protein S10
LPRRARCSILLRWQVCLGGPVRMLPTRRHRYTVIRSPHKDKDSREHFELRVHRRLLDLHDCTPKLVEGLQRTELPAEVQVALEVIR